MNRYISWDLDVRRECECYLYLIKLINDIMLKYSLIEQQPENSNLKCFLSRQSLQTAGKKELLGSFLICFEERMP